MFGQIRWSHWSQFKLSPQAFAAASQGRSLTDLDDATTYTLGLAQKLGPQWSGFVALGYDPQSGKTPLSPLRPSSGRVGYTLGLSYQHERVKIAPWISYQRLGATDVSSTRHPWPILARVQPPPWG